MKRPFAGVRKKLNSQRGASITIALLFFLICAVIGSVVLAAGTAAAGRVSSIAESDQKYKSVSSAAKMIRDWVDGKQVTVVTDTTTGYNAVCKYTSENGVYKEIEGTYDDTTPNGEGSSLTHFPGSTEAVSATPDYSILTNASLKVAEVYSAYSASFTVKPNLGEGANNMDVKVEVTFTAGTTLKFVFSDPSGECVMSFTAEAQLNENTSVGEGVAVEGSQTVTEDTTPGQFIRTWKITKTSNTIKTVGWTASDIKKAG